jgi:hypothetical protein
MAYIRHSGKGRNPGGEADDLDTSLRWSDVIRFLQNKFGWFRLYIVGAYILKIDALRYHCQVFLPLYYFHNTQFQLLYKVLDISIELT